MKRKMPPTGNQVQLYISKEFRRTLEYLYANREETCLQDMIRNIITEHLNKGKVDNETISEYH